MNYALWGVFGLLLITIETQAREPLIEIQEPYYPRNADASYCRRKTDIVDTIVFHHSQTTTTTTPEDINEMHLERGTAEDPWLMIGYHFTINSPYVDSPRYKTYVSRGRPFHIAGSHAGSDVYSKVTPETKLLLSKKDSVRCGTETGVVSEADDKFNPDGFAKANYTTVAIVLIGNYFVRNQSNPGGYPIGSERFPTARAIDAAARLACQLQKDNPRIQNIKWHSFYRATSCPAKVRERINAIITQTEKYGCKFQ